MADIGRLLREARAALKASKRVDYYALLEVDATASDVDIKKVRPWRRLRGGGVRPSAHRPRRVPSAPMVFMDCVTGVGDAAMAGVNGSSAQAGMRPPGFPGHIGACPPVSPRQWRMERHRARYRGRIKVWGRASANIIGY